MQLSSTLDTARKHLDGVDPAALTHARDRLAETGIARLGFLLPYRVKRSLAAEALTLVEHHRNWESPAPETEPARRRAIAVEHNEVTARGHCIPALYDCEPLRHKLTVIATEPVLPCPAPRRFAVTRRHHDDSPTRWHWDDYAFTLVLVVECPPLEEGGFVQTVPHTRPDRRHTEINRTLTRNAIHSWELNPGDLYLLRADTTLHRVHPFDHGRRTTIHMTFASTADLEREQASSTLSSGLSNARRVMTNHAY
ncbi:HalD/BesD family halogenase [Nocardia inohanensis]|uniref:HalD/BesD family halogenase n=1 Tax=Nocardia inohanensis TaxID=209246 RepID=UPI000AEFFDA5|nr:hypothetical protein [Nocardia inohanensis]